MLDPETFLTELYVLIDDLCQHLPAPPPHPGPRAALDPSEVITLALFGQWEQFPSQAAFYRYARQHLRSCFPALPSRPQFTRQLQRLHDLVAHVAVALGTELATTDHAFEIVDGTGVVTRNKLRRGPGWLPGEADIGRCTRLGFYEGVRVLLCCTPNGAITGFGCGPASTNDRVLADTFFSVRAHPTPRLCSVGHPVSDCYVADMGFAGRQREQRWRTELGVALVCPPQTGSRRAWPKPWRRWLAGIRQVMETVTDRVLVPCGVDRLRPHALRGLQARLAAAIGLFNACVWLNRAHHRPWLAFADLVDW
jgi:hypothetical protein